MPYDHGTVQKCLAAIKSISPEIELVRTGIFRPSRSQRLQQFALVCAEGRVGLRVSETLQPIDEDQLRLCKFLRIDSDQAGALIMQLSSLCAHNEYGSWVISPAPAPTLELGGESHNLLDSGASMLTSVHGFLVDALPGVHEIRIEECMTAFSSGSMRRRPCIRAMATDDIELASIDTTLFPAHLQALLLPGKFAKSHHHYRVAAWASQLATGVDFMARFLNYMNLLAVSLPITRIVLHPTAQTGAFWKGRMAG